MCDYKKKYKHNLEQHNETDNTKVEHKCDLCDYKFTMKDNIRQHVKLVREGIYHQCEYCSHKASTNIIVITATIKLQTVVIVVNIKNLFMKE